MWITTFEIIEALAITRASLQQWIDKGFTRPSIQRADGVGTKSLFAEQDVFEIMLMRLLQEVGLTLKQGRKLVDENCDKIHTMLKEKKHVFFVVRINSQFEKEISLQETIAGIESELIASKAAIQIVDISRVEEWKSQVLEKIQEMKMRK